MSTTFDLDLQSRIDTYLMNLRRCLGELPPEEVNDILREIRSHILERAETAGELTDEKLVAILKALGKPEDIGPLYQADAMVARARSSFSPTLIFRTVLRWAMKSALGFATFLVGFTGYGIALSFLACAVMKPIFPDHVGAWLGDGGFSMGMKDTPGQNEILGWWIIPVGLVAGTLLVIATTRFLRWMLRFAARRPMLAAVVSAPPAARTQWSASDR
jgi:uncharacterized membrane protein